MKLISLLISVSLLVACSTNNATPTIEQTRTEEPVIDGTDIEDFFEAGKIEDAYEEDSIREPDDLFTRPGESWRPRDYDFRANCLGATVDERLPPAVWFEEYKDTQHKVLEEFSHIYGTDTLPLVSEHITFWETWCPPSGWEEPHIILLMGLYYIEDAYYFERRLEHTGHSDYAVRADHAEHEGFRYLQEGIRDAIPWYGEMPVYAEDPRVGLCLQGGLRDHQYVPLCDDYSGPYIDPDSDHYDPDPLTISKLLERRNAP